MTVPAAFLPEAEEDIVRTRDYYQEHREGLGDEFIEALRKVLDNIQDNPQLYGVFRSDIRAALLKRFPYVVYYRDRGKDVLIIAIQHGRRSTRAWWRRT
jgi:plasmid stabilization system protein ParE